MKGVSNDWNQHRDRQYIKANRFGVPFLIAGKRLAKNQIYWLAYIVDPVSEKPISEEPFFHHEHLRSLEYQIDRITMDDYASRITGETKPRESLSNSSSTTVINNYITVDARSIRLYKQAFGECSDSFEWAKVQCKKMGWPEPPRRFLEGAASVFNNEGGEKAIKYIGEQMQRRFYGLNKP